jgi:hypothetical protein
MDPADLPHDGRGGYLYTQNIAIPNYANTTTYTTYSAIDDYLFTGSGSATTLGVTFGACLMTLIHVIVFTTPDKRGRIIFNCIVVGLSGGYQTILRYLGRHAFWDKQFVLPSHTDT